jgi:hypothetical protein
MEGEAVKEGLLVGDAVKLAEGEAWALSVRGAEGVPQPALLPSPPLVEVGRFTGEGLGLLVVARRQSVVWEGEARREGVEAPEAVGAEEALPVSVGAEGEGAVVALAVRVGALGVGGAVVVTLDVAEALPPVAEGVDVPEREAVADPRGALGLGGMEGVSGEEAVAKSENESVALGTEEGVEVKRGEEVGDVEVVFESAWVAEEVADLGGVAEAEALCVAVAVAEPQEVED